MPKGRFSAADIEVLTGIEAVRRRPSMYVGDPTQTAALAQVTLEPLCFALDQKTGGPAKSVTVTLRSDDTAEIVNDGPGLPLTSRTDGAETHIELIMTKLHACRDEKSEEANKQWCHGGVAVLCALAEWCVVTVKREGGIWKQRFEKGVVASRLEREGDASTTGTSVLFKPDRTILSAPFDAALLAERLDQLARDVHCLIVTLSDLRTRDAF